MFTWAHGLIINVKKAEDFRMAKSNRSMVSLQKTIRNKGLSWKSKIRIYKTVIRPTMLDGSETWTLTKREETKIQVWERKILRKIFGGRKTEGGWERRSNIEIYELFNEPAIDEVMRSKKLQWLGHMETMDDLRTMKGIEGRGTEGRRKPGRPRKEWREMVWEDIRRRNITNWKEKAKEGRNKTIKYRAMDLNGLEEAL